MQDTYTEDTLLGGTIRLKQPSKGYRVAIDPFFLSAAVDISPQSTVLDVGTGVGTALLCLAKHTPCQALGIDNQKELITLAKENAILNALEESVKFQHLDISSPHSPLSPQTFDHVITNPPYYIGGTPSPYTSKAGANLHSTATLEMWLQFCFTMMKPSGTLTLIYQTNQLNALMQPLLKLAKGILLFPLWPKTGKPAKRILLQAHKNGKQECTLLPGMILHNEDGSYTEAAEKILRGGEKLSLKP